MKLTKHFPVIPIFLALFLAFAVLPSGAAHAGLVPCGASVDDPVTSYNETEQCSLCHLVKGVSYLTTYIRDIMVFIALAVITAMGIMYIVSAGNDSMMGTAKKGIWAALIGLAIVLLAWVVVNTIIFVIFQSKANLGVGASFTVGNGFSFDCNANL